MSQSMLRVDSFALEDIGRVTAMAVICPHLAVAATAVVALLVPGLLLPPGLCLCPSSGHGAPNNSWDTSSTGGHFWPEGAVPGKDHLCASSLPFYVTGPGVDPRIGLLNPPRALPTLQK